jgi:hypothetical protein
MHIPMNSEQTPMPIVPQQRSLLLRSTTGCERSAAIWLVEPTSNPLSSGIENSLALMI